MPLPQISRLLQSLEQPSPLILLPSSQTSPGSRRPLPQNSTWQVGPQPSPLTVLPSSQASPGSTTPSPQISRLVQVALQSVAARPCCRRRRLSPASSDAVAARRRASSWPHSRRRSRCYRRRTPRPWRRRRCRCRRTLGSCSRLEQPSPLTCCRRRTLARIDDAVAADSHLAGGAAAVAAHGVAVVALLAAAVSTMPLPHVSLLRQVLLQPSPSRWLPSSQTSPGSSDAVAARGEPAVAFAAVAVQRVAVVALLAGGDVHDAVAADLAATGSRPSSRRRSMLPSSHCLAGLDDAVAAALEQAGGAAAVAVQRVAVVALLAPTMSTMPLPQSSLVLQSLEQPSPSRVAVVADLAGVDDAVAAKLDLAGRAAAVAVQSSCRRRTARPRPARRCRKGFCRRS